MALPPLDRDAVRASIGHLTGVSDHVTALADLEGDHEDLQRRFRELRVPLSRSRKSWHASTLPPIHSPPSGTIAGG
ncbi:hypothetical protein PF003_g19783 [Phytophthora fragariae]|nr:hypothetical protein PF003_g19783 [Phytophthora fragariae]